MFHVYALYSPFHQKIYIGYTSNLIERLKSHNYLANKGYTVKYRPWVIIYKKMHRSRKEAIQREKQLKSARGREFIWSIINDV